MYTLRMYLNTFMIIGFTIATILVVIFAYADHHELPALLQKSGRCLLLVDCVMIIAAMIHSRI